MRTSLAPLALALVALLLAQARPASGAKAIRGYNTWYSVFGSLNETGALAAGAYMSSRLLPFGYDTLTLDEGWAYSSGKLLLDANGIPTPNAEMFPNGMPWLAQQLASMGIKLGLWVIRGIPREAVERKLPIKGSGFTADQAARYDRNCSWSGDIYGSNAPSAAASAYYGSLAQSFAKLGAQFVKIDCLWPNLYEGTPQVYFNEDVVAETRAFTTIAPPFTVSLSPGISVSPQNGTFLAQGRYANLYRIAEDVLDVYDGKPDGTFPQGVHQKLTKALEYEALLGGDGISPDFDMLMVGRTIHAYDAGLGPRSGLSAEPTETHLTRAEQVTEMTLFAFTGVPLIMGGLLPLTDDANGTWTLSLLTNSEILATNNQSAARKSFVPAPRAAELYGWQSTPINAEAPASTRYAALFNAETTSQTASARFVEDLGLPVGTATVCLRDLWAETFDEPVGGALPSGGLGFAAGVDAHGARAFLVAPVGSSDCRTGLAG